MRIKQVIAAVFMMVGTNGWAGIDPINTAGDPRVKVVAYNHLEVTQITSYTKVGTTIQIDPSETYINHATGAMGAFSLSPLDGGRLILKPTVSYADTNLTIFTDKRTYLIELKIRDPKTTHQGSVKVRDPNLTFLLYYQYPEEETRRASERYKKQLALRNSQKQQECDTQGQIDASNLNFNYALSGQRAIAPNVVFDDGLFTYIQFPKDAPIPAVYSVDNKLNETVMNVRMEGRQLVVVEQLADRFTLRHGESVVTVVRNPEPQLVRDRKEEEKHYAGW